MVHSRKTVSDQAEPGPGGGSCPPVPHSGPLGTEPHDPDRSTGIWPAGRIWTPVVVEFIDGIEPVEVDPLQLAIWQLHPDARARLFALLREVR